MDPVDRFMTNLTSAFRKTNLARETYDLYVQKLGRWRLTADQWSAAASQIISNESAFPALSEIFPYLRAACAAKKLATFEPIWQCFEYQGKPYARKITDPSNPPPLPAGAAKETIVMPPEVTDYQHDSPISGARARELGVGFVAANEIAAEVMHNLDPVYDDQEVPF